MMHLFDSLVFSKKKSSIILVLMVSYILWLIYQSYLLWNNPDDRQSILFYEKALTHHLIFSIVPCLISWVWLDLMHPHDRVFISTRYRYYLWDMKGFYVAFVSGLYVVFFYLSYQIIFWVWLPLNSLIQVWIEPFHLWLDVMILYLFSHLLAHEKTKTLSLIFPLVYLMFQLLMQGQSSWMMFLILPLYQENIIHYQLALTYKLWYIGLGFMITRFFFGKIARYG